MNILEKVAIFLMLLGFERASSIIELMDNDEIKTIIPRIGKLTDIAPEEQAYVWGEFEHLGYEDQMKPAATLGIIRLLFNGSKIRDKDKKDCYDNRSYRS